ncbi:hypothetical protein ASPZODRAFT_127690 [Penicilliopsis zonata CBS 506.65]|uniref:Uncharacterized protein n=1 Tax=Penicilliopsis zonata CBS 506.65 TaxID=1073090 RepID=A0A1L9SWQ7_9EURO|nr:hypothetical protein ASPZODRAFT_127690 [Penicilliopsis zonata CBS 506.65]OJJ51594.1 hypothetical protein ASPZODRAFT_127690 [Penicilliopsis zonata CBS 506.65]
MGNCPHHSEWDDFDIDGFRVNVLPLKEGFLWEHPTPIPPYFWGGSEFDQRRDDVFPIHSGYAEVRGFIDDGGTKAVERITTAALGFVTSVFDSMGDSERPKGKGNLVQLRLSDDLLRWRREKHDAGYILPAKGKGLKMLSPEVLEILRVSRWPIALTQTSSLFGVGIANLLIGAHDVQTLFSNYLIDMGFYMEHGYHYVFPEFEPLIEKAKHDAHALQTLGGVERREAAALGIKYIKGKIALEERHKADVTYYSARMDRRTVQMVGICESSLLGMTAEAITRGYDAGAAFSDLVFSNPATDVVDVGSDILNSEVMNSFLNTADITSTGVVSEEVLRRVYDACAHTGARALTERWSEPLARMCSMLYPWHICNDRHMFLRRAILGWEKVRKVPSEQREADFDEAFDEDYFTTGFSRPLKNACSGGDVCDAVSQLVASNKRSPIIAELWKAIVTDPLQYVRAGIVSQERESELAENLQLTVAKSFSQGLVLELAWLMAHADHHAWQVNYLFEAAMFGSILDSGALAGKLDRADRGTA